MSKTTLSVTSTNSEQVPTREVTFREILQNQYKSLLACDYLGPRRQVRSRRDEFAARMARNLIEQVQAVYDDVDDQMVVIEKICEELEGGWYWEEIVDE
jgi:hypothetical protein